MYPTIVIIGAGFGGIELAKNLANQPLNVVLIDKNNYHTFQPLLYQVATGGLEPSNIAYPVRRIFRKQQNFRFQMADVLHIHSTEKFLETSIGKINYDYLVIATGSTNNFFNFDNIKNDFLTLKTINDALDIRSNLFQNLEKITAISDEELKDETVNVSIIGAGPAGIEIAGALAEMRKKVLPKDFPEFDFKRMHIYLFEAAPRVLANMSEQASKAAFHYLKGLEIDVQVNARVKNYDQHHVYLEDGTKFRSATVIWTAGVKGFPIEGLPQESIVGNRIDVNEFYQLKTNPFIFAVGDVAVHIDEENPRGLPMLAQVAIQEGKHLAKNLIRLIEGKQMTPFKYKNKGIMATIGRNKAVVDLPKFKFHGQFAWMIWLTVHIIALVGFRNKLITFIDWTQNYFSYDRPLRAIIRKYQKKV